MASSVGVARAAGNRWLASRLRVQRVGLNVQDIVAIAKLAGLGGEAEVGNRRNLHRNLIAGENLEAGSPGSVGFVLEIQS